MKTDFRSLLWRQLPSQMKRAAELSRIPFSIREIDRARDSDYFGMSRCLSFLLQTGTMLGFTAHRLSRRCGYVAWEGADAGHVAVLCHLDDLTGIRGSQVSHNRLQFISRCAISLLFAVKALRDSGVIPRVGIRLIYGMDSEDGYTYVPDYLLRSSKSTTRLLFAGAFCGDALEPGLLYVRIAFPRTRAHSVQTAPWTLLQVAGGDRADIVPDLAVADLQFPGLVASEAISLLDALANELNVQHQVEPLPLRDRIGLRLRVFGCRSYSWEPRRGRNAALDLVRLLAGLPIPEAELFRHFALFSTAEGLPCASVNLGRIYLEGERLCGMYDIRYWLESEALAVRKRFYDLKESGASIKILRDLSIWRAPDSEDGQFLCDFGDRLQISCRRLLKNTTMLFAEMGHEVGDWQTVETTEKWAFTIKNATE